MDRVSPIAAVLLAAGESQRMGSVKALLKWDNLTFIETIFERLPRERLCEKWLVLGHEYRHILQVIDLPRDFRLIQNPHPETGQLVSIQLAIRQISYEAAGMLLILVDHPAVTAVTYRMLIDAATKHPEQIIIPEYRGRRGHPVYFSCRFYDDLLNASAEVGAREVVHRHSDQVINLKVDDPGILKDIDTPADYKKLTGKS